MSNNNYKNISPQQQPEDASKALAALSAYRLITMLTLFIFISLIAGLGIKPIVNTLFGIELGYWETFFTFLGTSMLLNNLGGGLAATHKQQALDVVEKHIRG